MRDKKVNHYVFEWKDGSGTIGAAEGEDLKAAKRDLWEQLADMKHYFVMDQLREGKPYRVKLIGEIETKNRISGTVGIKGSKRRRKGNAERTTGLGDGATAERARNTSHRRKRVRPRT